MRIPRRWGGLLLALAVMSSASACADDTPATTIDFGDGTSVGGTENPATTSTTGMADTTETSPGTGSGTATGSGGETETTTGEPPALPGQSVSQIVSAGERSTSGSYVLVFTVGQPSQLQSVHESGSYRLRGGLIGANGSPP